MELDCIKGTAKKNLTVICLRICTAQFDLFCVWAFSLFVRLCLCRHAGADVLGAGGNQWQTSLG